MNVDHTDQNREAIRDYIKPQFAVDCEVDWEPAGPERSGTYFRVHCPRQLNRALRISQELLEDDTPKQLIRRLEEHRAIEEMGRHRFVVLTTEGLDLDPPG